MSKYGVFPGRYFPVFALNTETYYVNLRIHSKNGKILSRKNSVFGYFLRSARLEYYGSLKFTLFGPQIVQKLKFSIKNETLRSENDAILHENWK